MKDFNFAGHLKSLKDVCAELDTHERWCNAKLSSIKLVHCKMLEMMKDHVGPEMEESYQHVDGEAEEQATREAQAQQSTGIRPSTVTGTHCTKPSKGLPDGSKSLSKIHPLGTIPKYLQRNRQRKATASSSVQAPLDVKVEPPTEQLQIVPVKSEAALEAEYKQQTIDRLEHQVLELLGELGNREQRIKELEVNLYRTQHTLAQMQNMMQSHLKAQQPIVKKIAQESKVLLLLQMILDSQANNNGESVKDHEPK
uniref:Uncharacterized protein n=1 Tax=Anopheles culicifacies TaxID=139723 RepID=A0A182MLF7_9DIPT